MLLGKDDTKTINGHGSVLTKLRLDCKSFGLMAYVGCYNQDKYNFYNSSSFKILRSQLDWCVYKLLRVEVQWPQPQQMREPLESHQESCVVKVSWVY